MSLLEMGFDVLGGCYLALICSVESEDRSVHSPAQPTGYIVVLGLRYAIVAASGHGCPTGD